MWKVLFSEMFRSAAAVALAIPVIVVAALVFDTGEDSTSIAKFMALVMIGAVLLFYVAVTLGVFLAAPHAKVKAWAASQKRPTFLGRYVWLTQPGGGLAIYFAVAALITALGVLPSAADIAGKEAASWIAGMTVVMVFMGWLAVSATYAVDYLVSHQQLGPDTIMFPGTEDPPFSDYLYLAIGVTAAFAPPDVSIRSSLIRRRMTLQMLIGFVFATVTLAAVVGSAMGPAGA
ncbi:MAG: DUF1345 domain-containing protein [Propionibacteriaceae bacterium]|nr:DUF1345 domain-containing protein [Propionibacteriaceae bacterium]